MNSGDFVWFLREAGAKDVNWKLISKFGKDHEMVSWVVDSACFFVMFDICSGIVPDSFHSLQIDPYSKEKIPKEYRTSPFFSES